MKKDFETNKWAGRIVGDELSEIGLYSKRVLVIEDITYVQRIISRALTEAGYTVIIASNGEDAIEMIKRYTPALVTIDMNLPDTKGALLLEIIKKQFTDLNIKTIFISAVTNRNEIKSVLSRGADYYLIKPFKKSDLLDCVETIMQARDREMNKLSESPK